MLLQKIQNPLENLNEINERQTNIKFIIKYYELFDFSAVISELKSLSYYINSNTNIIKIFNMRILFRINLNINDFLCYNESYKS